jgi:PncC family amidohydrolase
VLAATMVNDAAQGMGLYPTVPMIPLGYLALALGTGFTLVTRYGTLSVELEQRSKQLRASCEQLQASYEQLEQTQQELVKSEQLAVVGEFAAVIAHEVRNPLAVVSNAVASLRKAGTAATDRTLLLGIIEEEMMRLDDLVGQLLKYARPVVPTRRPVDLREVLDRSLAVASDDGRIHKALDVDPELMRAHGAVSEEVACAMADGVRRRLGVDWGVSTTGIAGPDGGSVERPIGTVCVGLAGPEAEVEARTIRLGGDRELIRRWTVAAALDALRRGKFGRD